MHRIQLNYALIVVTILAYDDQKVTVAKLREVINNTGFTCEVPKSAKN